MQVDSVRVGMAQIRVEPGRASANLDRAVAAVARAGRMGCQVVALPECLDLGWTDPSARDLAVPIPGTYSDRLTRAALENGVYVAAGLVERAANRLYNAAVLIAPDGRLLLHHRKINELDFALDLYHVGDRLGVVDTPLGTLALAICSDNFPSSLAIGHVLARMGAQLLLSPCSWAVEPDHDPTREPYGQLWIDAYTELARLYDLAIVGVSHVGSIVGGPWSGRKVIGCSLAVAPGGHLLARGPYGEEAETILAVDLPLRHPIATGASFQRALADRGYQGP